MDNLTPKEIADEEMINQAFHELLNGAAARKVQPDDIVIIMSYALMDFEEAKSFKPSVIFPDPATNKVVK